MPLSFFLSLFLSSLYFFLVALLMILLVLLALFGQDTFFFIKLTQQDDDCVLKDFSAISFYDAQYLSWTDDGRSFHRSTGGF